MPFFIFIILAAALLTILFFMRSGIEREMIKTEYYEIKTEKLADNHRLIFISDLHSHVFGKDNEELFTRIAELKPEAVLIGGDMITCGRKTDNPPKMEVVSSLLDKLTEAGLPVYYAEGNHETRCFERFAGTYEKWKLKYNDSVYKNLHYLDDSYAFYESGAGKDRLRIFGLTLGDEFYERQSPGLGNKYEMPEHYIEEKTGFPNKDEFTVLLMHSPLYLKEAAAWGADLVLSGHFHGGTIRLPIAGGVMTPQLQFFVKECAGEHREGDTVMIVNRGLGTHSVNIRFNNLPEISCIDIKGMKK